MTGTASAWTPFIIGVFTIWSIGPAIAYRIFDPNDTRPAYFEPYHPGFVGISGDPANTRRLRVNEGNQFTRTQPNVFEGVNPRQNCPGMVGPFEGYYYCTHAEAGYCDRRSGTCFCYEGYQGLDCADCRPTHYREGNICKKKKLCVDNCSGGGVCDYSTGKCQCEEYRTGENCAIPFCKTFDEKCLECTRDYCRRCMDGYYVTDANKCLPCTQYDPRCTACDTEQCLECSDPLLKSIRRSGGRKYDTPLPFDELVRQLATALPFGSKSPFAFEEAEPFYLTSDMENLRRQGIVVDRTWNPDPEDYDDHSTTTGSSTYSGDYIPPPPPPEELRSKAVSCVQGLSFDDRWDCEPFAISHRYCGNPGTFSFTSPTYSIPEENIAFPMTIQRSGGGLGATSVLYRVYHVSTSASDVTPTAQYTAQQRVEFEEYAVSKTFQITINDDLEIEGDEKFLVVLSDPRGGAVLGPQRVAEVTIIDDDSRNIHLQNTLVDTSNFDDPVVAGTTVTYSIEARGADNTLFTGNSERFVTYLRDPLSAYGGELGAGGQIGVYDYFDSADDPVTGRATGPGAGRPRLNDKEGRVLYAGTSGFYRGEIQVQMAGDFELVVMHAKPGGLLGEYFDNAYLIGDPVVSRIDHVLNFTWGWDRITERGTDYVSARWTGALLTPAQTGEYKFLVNADDNVRLWVDRDLLIDRWADPAGRVAGRIYLQANRLYDFRVEYRDRIGTAYCKLAWELPDGTRGYIEKEHYHSLRHVASSPYDISIISDVAYAGGEDSVGSVASGPGLMSTTAGVPGIFYIYPRDRFDNDRLSLGENDVFKVVAVMREGSGTGLDGTSGQPFLEEAPATLLWDNTLLSWWVEYQPNIAGVYDLHVRLYRETEGDYQHIYGSPFTVTVNAAASSGGASEAFGAGLSGGVAGTPFVFTVVARDSLNNLVPTGGDDFRINAVLPGTDVGVQGNFIDYGNGTYLGNFIPQVAGTYQLNVYLRGVHVAASPYSVVVVEAPTKGSRCLASGIGLKNATSGVEVSFFVTMYDAFDNLRPQSTGDDILVELTGPDTFYGTIGTPVDGVYEVTYTPTKIGVYTLNVIVEGEHITGSPFRPSVVPGAADASTSSATGQGLITGIAGDIQYFTVQVRDSSANNRISGEDIVEVVATNPMEPAESKTGDCLYLSHGVHACSYNVTATGTYSLEVTVNSDPIIGSPFAPLITPAAFSAYTSVLTGTGLVGTTAGIEAPVFLRAVDSYGNDRLMGGDAPYLAARLKSVSTSEELVLDVKDVGNGDYEIPYTPLTSGQYVLTLDQFLPQGLYVTYYDQATFLSPVVSRLESTLVKDFGTGRAAAGMSRTERWSVEWRGFLRVNTTERFSFTATAVQGNAELSIISQNRSSVPTIGSTLAQSGSGTGTMQSQFDAAFSANDVVVSVAEGGGRVATGEVNLIAGLLYPFRFRYAAGVGPAAVSLLYESPSTTPPRPLRSTFLYPPWSYRVHDSPYYPYVDVAPASPSTTYAEGQALTQAVANVSTGFRVYTVDEFGNHLYLGANTIKVYAVRLALLPELGGAKPEDEDSEVMFQADVVDLLNGQYDVTYTPKEAGIYSLRVLLNPSSVHPDFGPGARDEVEQPYNIVGSPFSLKVHVGATLASTSFAYGGDLESSEAGLPHWFYVQIRDEMGNNRTQEDVVVAQLRLRTVRGLPPPTELEQQIVTTGVVTSLGRGLYNVSFVPTVAGECEWEITVAGGLTESTTYAHVVHPTKADGPSSTAVGVEDATTAVGVEHHFVVTARDSFSNRRWDGGDMFSVEILHPVPDLRANIPHRGVVKNHQDGTYEVFYTPPFEGAYQLSVMLVGGTGGPNGLLAEYYGSPWMTGQPLYTQVDGPINFNWTVSPKVLHDSSPQLYAGVRWSGYIQAPANGTYEFTATSADGVRLHIDKLLVIDALDAPAGVRTGKVPKPLIAGQVYSIDLEYRQQTGAAYVSLEWRWYATDAPPQAPVPLSALFPRARHISGSPFDMMGIEP